MKNRSGAIQNTALRRDIGGDGHMRAQRRIRIALGLAATRMVDEIIHPFCLAGPVLATRTPPLCANPLSLPGVWSTNQQDMPVPVHGRDLTLSGAQPAIAGRHIFFAASGATPLSAGNSTVHRIPAGTALSRFDKSSRTPNVPLAASKTLSTTEIFAA